MKELNFVDFLDLQFFAEDSPTGERTEEATERRLKKAREKGDVPKSVELVTALILFTTVLFFYWYSKYFFSQLYISCTQLLKIIDHDFTQEFYLFYIYLFKIFFKVILPFFVFIIIIAILSNVVQFGVLLTTEPLKPDLAKLNPIEGFKRIFSLNSVNELVKSILKLIILLIIPYLEIRSGKILCGSKKGGSAEGCHRIINISI